MTKKVALITGAARRVGAEVARYLHTQGMNVIIHYLTSVKEAEQLAETLNAQRPNSAAILAADLNQHEQVEKLAQEACLIWGRLDVLVNNASRYYPTPIGTATEQQWDDLFANNLKAPFFLSQACATALKNQQGCIVNIADINATRPRSNYPIYCAAKGGLVTLTRALALDLAPTIRVNAVAPGPVLWPEGEAEDRKAKVISEIALNRLGAPIDIAKAVWFFIHNADFITGQVLSVDGYQQ